MAHSIREDRSIHGEMAYPYVYTISKFQFSARADGLDVSYEASDVGYRDLTLLGGYRLPYKNVPIFIQGGYRWNFLDMTVDDGMGRFGLDMGFEGPFLAVTSIF